MFVVFSFHIIYMRCKIGHAHCFNDHSMTDSDGKPLVFAYSLEYFDRYMKGHPDFLLHVSSEDKIYGNQIHDSFDEYPDEELD